jgi:hypothetical protein
MPASNKYDFDMRVLPVHMAAVAPRYSSEGMWTEAVRRLLVISVRYIAGR